ncbi:modular serine protease-like [Leptopilina heterotoma]|uniref:modular serine protease-like n=1 Tax=Leptopilina heterotoma TaxID=63436 RepID=UPI001CA7C3E0|nr:modular serine protease-like [Leptopilina heterotoma]
MDSRSTIFFCVLLLAVNGKASPAGEDRKTCGNFQYKCKNGDCIPQDRLCDGHTDCSDESDETREACKTMRCSPYVFKCEYGACVDGDSICNGIKDCADNSDETLPSCSRNNSTIVGECRSNQFKCKNGQCIESTSLCDGTVDCRDESDETAQTCSSFPCDSYVFRCTYGACIDLDLRCNGAVNCADGSDEDPTLCIKGSTDRPKVTSRPTTNRPNSQRPTPRPITQRTTQRPTQRPVAEITCRVPQQPPNGHYKLYKSHCSSGEHCNVSPGVRTLEKGTQLIYSCASGFRMEGYKDVLCGPDGKWLNTPKCIEIRCPGLSSVTMEAYCVHNNKHVPCEESVLPFTSAELRCRASYHQEQNHYSLPIRKEKVICNETGHWSPDPIECVADCGKAALNVVQLIVNGTLAKPSEFPWHATMYRQDHGNDEKQFICGASIIQEDLLITAAHCVYDESSRRLYDASRFYVATGNIFRDYDAPSPYVQRRKVKSIFIRCTYRGLQGLYANDIAILELKESFIFTGLLMPICLDYRARLGNKPVLETGNLGRVPGFGRTEEGSTSYILRSIAVPYISQQQCETAAAETDSASFITADKFCAGYTNGSSVCDGDSGGGLVFKDKELWFLRGIVSVGIGAKGDNGERTCNSYTYSLYTEIASGNLDWIQDVVQNLRSNKFYPQCHVEEIKFFES